MRVINFVTRDTIEERVLEVIQQKRELFTGLFDGDSDEVSFNVAGQTPFLDTLRDMVGVPGVEALRHPSTGASKTPPQPPTSGDRLLQAGVEMLEALAEMLANRTANAEQVERAKPLLPRRKGLPFARNVNVLRGFDRRSKMTLHWGSSSAGRALVRNEEVESSNLFCSTFATQNGFQAKGLRHTSAQGIALGFCLQ